MPPTTVKQAVHRPGPLKQSNKSHKGGRGKGNKNDKGKQDVKTISRHRTQLNRMERKNQLNQIRKAKREEVLKQKRRLGSLQAPPIITTIISLDDSISSWNILIDLQSCDEDGLIVSDSATGHKHLRSPRLKQRFTFLTPKKTDLHFVMDALKVSEMLILVHSSETPDEYTEMLLSVIITHAFPTTIHVAKGLDKLNPKKKAEFKKQVFKNMEAKFPDLKLQQADTRKELQLLLRQIGSQKQRGVAFRDNRFHLLAEEIAFSQVNETTGKGTLKVSGYVRGQPLNVNGLVHLTGWGNFQMSQIDYIFDPFVNEFRKTKEVETTLTETADPSKQQSLQSEVIPDPMEGEQTWPTQEELDAAELKTKTVKRKVIKGTSEYQSSWIMESENEDSEEEEEDSDAELCDESQNMSDDEESIANEQSMDDEYIPNIQDANYDKNLNMDEENETLVRFKEERMNQMFPDEQDTPIDVKARIRFQRYRGLKNFKSSPWDPMENLPYDYARIYRFEHFKQTKKKALKCATDGVTPGQYVTLYISDVPQALYDNVKSANSPLIVYGLLAHEQKMSLMNTVIRKHVSCKIPIKSKDTLIFHIGFSRFTVKPVFSEHKTGNKFKFERYLPSDTAVVASFYAPVLFPPASVVVFRRGQDGSHELVATGSVLDFNPNRVIVKRIVLSGHPFKIFKRACVVRYMFFNTEDIEWFKCVELQSKCGRRGHIRDSLGSHGHMKCIFDRQLPSQDVILMSLYKRVFPKWNYDSYVPDPVASTGSVENEMEAMTM